jgi:hypothetical protein
VGPAGPDTDLNPRLASVHASRTAHPLLGLTEAHSCAAGWDCCRPPPFSAFTQAVVPVLPIDPNSAPPRHCSRRSVAPMGSAPLWLHQDAPLSVQSSTAPLKKNNCHGRPSPLLTLALAPGCALCFSLKGGGKERPLCAPPSPGAHCPPRSLAPLLRLTPAFDCCFSSQSSKGPTPAPLLLPTLALGRALCLLLRGALPLRPSYFSTPASYTNSWHPSSV